MYLCAAGLTRLRAALADLAGLPLAQLCDALLERLRPGGLQDDIALVALRLSPGGAAPRRA